MLLQGGKGPYGIESVGEETEEALQEDDVPCTTQLLYKLALSLLKVIPLFSAVLLLDH